MKKIMLATLLLSGCFSMGRKLDQSKVSQIKKGDTKESVLQAIGSPDNMIMDGNGNTTFSYNYMRVSSHAANFIPIIGPLVGGHDVQHEMVIVTFSTSSLVSNIMTSYGATQTGMGANTASKATDIKAVEQNKRPE